MEGPSLYLAQEQLKPFEGQRVLTVSGNSKTDKERLAGKEIKEIFSWGKHLVFQFDTFAVRFHFLLFGTFTATVEGVAVTGDYKKTQAPRLVMTFPNGIFESYNCSVKFTEDKNLKSSYDFSIDIMSPIWDATQALKHTLTYPEAEIADVLLDQEIFAGVGNIIKNEILSIIKINPKTKVKALSKPLLKALINEAQAFSHQFLVWRWQFQLRINLKTHRKGQCQHCARKLIREKTGKRQRWSYYCLSCQPVVE